MWYKYIFPRRVFFLNTRPYRWLNFLLFKYPRELEWKILGLKLFGWYNQEAQVSFSHIPYTVGPTDDDVNLYSFRGPALERGYRGTRKECIDVCETHYKRNFLGIQGILN